MNAQTTLLDGYRAALDWWREAGVDLDFSDEPVAWLGDTEEDDAAPPPPPAPPRTPNALERALAGTAHVGTLGGERDGWPQSLDDFHEWWLREPSLDKGGLGTRVAPRGSSGAKIMIVVAQPDEGDRQVLLSGEQGRVFDAFARAAKLEEGSLYLASALPRPTAMPDWEALGERGLGEVLRHHIALARPQRLLVFGRVLAPLLGATPETRTFEGVPLLVAPTLERIDTSVAVKKRFWNNWLEWSA